VQLLVIFVGHYKKIFWRVVHFVAIYVMNVLAFIQATTNRRFRNKDVLITVWMSLSSPSWRVDKALPLFIDRDAAFPNGVFFSVKLRRLQFW
jgi:hypothetical protein